jgi:protein TonB
MELNPELEVTVDEVAELGESAPELVVEPVAEVTVEQPVAKTYKGRKSEPEPVVVEPTVEPEPEPEPIIEPVVEPAPAPIVEVTARTAMRIIVK